MAGNDLDILMASGKGAAAGAGKGAAIGGVLGSVVPGVGNAVGAAGGALIGGLAGGISSGIKQNQANQAKDIGFTDPLEAVRLAQLEQTRKNMLTGSNPVTQNKIGQIRNVGAAVQGGISRNTGGDVGATMDALLKAQKNTQTGVNNAISEGQQNLPYFDNAVGTLAQRIAQRKLELQLLSRGQDLAENAQSRKEANLNTNALVGSNGKMLTTDEMIALLQKRKLQEQNGGLSQTPEIPNQVDTSRMTNLSGDWAQGVQSFPDYQPVISQTPVQNNFDYSNILSQLRTEPIY